MKILWDTKIWSVLSFLSHTFELKKTGLKIIINIQYLCYFFKNSKE
jgi:hypothetical protein